MESEELTVGLCATCVHCRTVQTARSVFYLCVRSFVDERFRKYPPLPVIRCIGYERGGEEPSPKSEESAF